VTDSDGDPLEFLWQSEGGTVTEPGSLKTTWELFTSAEPYSYEKISLTVTDGKESVTRFETIQLSEGLLVTGFTYFNGTTIPVPGVKMQIGKFSALSDDQGFYAIEHLKEGYTLVTAVKEGFDTYDSLYYVDNPKSVYNIPMTSPTRTSKVSGNIRTIDQQTRAGLKVTLLNPDETDSELSGFTDENGFYEIANVPNGNRSLLIRSEDPESHFLHDSIIIEFDVDGTNNSHDARIKIKRTIIDDIHLSEKDIWEFNGDISDGFYSIGKGQQMNLKDSISIPLDTENELIYLYTYVVGGCDMVAGVPSHRVWISISDGKYLGGISWGGKGSNYIAEVSWSPSTTPSFLNINGKQIRLHLELFEENDCVSNPLWRVYQIGFSYYY
jgi:hypothetical protein